MYSDREQISGCLGIERGTYGKGWKEGYKKTQTLGIKDIFIILIVEMVSQVYVYVKIYQIICFINI